MALIKKRRTKSDQMKLRDRADKLAGDKCRARGVCQAVGLDRHVCKGALQWCHIVERSEHGIRWAQENCLCMCQAAHLYYTYRPFRWQLFLQEHFPEQYAWVREHITDTFDYNYERLIAELEEE